MYCLGSGDAQTCADMNMTPVLQEYLVMGILIGLPGTVRVQQLPLLGERIHEALFPAHSS